MAAIQHQNRGARALIFRLVYVEIGIFQLNRDLEPLPLNGRRERLADIQIEGIAEFVELGGAAGFDSGGQVARIVRAETRLTERSEQILEGLES